MQQKQTFSAQTLALSVTAAELGRAIFRAGQTGSVRAVLLSLPRGRTWWFHAAHHVVLDGYGAQQLLRRVCELYDGAAPAYAASAPITVTGCANSATGKKDPRCHVTVTLLRHVMSRRRTEQRRTE